MPSEEPDTETGRKKVCRALDQTLIDFFSTLTELRREQSRLHQAMKSGFVNLSRARYSMGIRNVGIQQFDETKMKASVKVTVNDDDTFSSHTSNNADQEDVESLGMTGEPSTACSVRQRKPAAHTEDGFEVIEKIEDIKLDDIKDSYDSKPQATSETYDPLRWFGILVPPTLRQCQKDFRSTANIVLSIANLQKKIGTLQKEYGALMEQKVSLSA